MGSLSEHVIDHPPRCISSLPGATVEIPVDSADECVYVKVLDDGAEVECSVYGYDVGRLSETDTGPLSFVSPLFLQRAGDSHRYLILDTQIHGYHGELDSSAKVRGSGAPGVYACDSCATERFFVQITLVYGPAVQDLRDDEPELPIQDYFTGFLLSGTCTNCGRTASIVELDL